MADVSTYGHQDEHLTMIISKTAEAIEHMHRLNNNVQMHAQMLPTVNRSVSGNLLGGHFDSWSQTHNTVVNHLNQLNQKATALRNLNNSTNQQAGEAAR